MNLNLIDKPSHDKSATFDAEYKDEWEFLEILFHTRSWSFTVCKYYESNLIVIVIDLLCKKKLFVALTAGSLLTQGAGNSEIHVIVYCVRKYNISFIN